MTDTLWSRFLKLPEAITPVYETARPNTPIALYSGDLELLQDGRSPVVAQGTLHLEWLPSLGA